MQTFAVLSSLTLEIFAVFFLSLIAVHFLVVTAFEILSEVQPFRQSSHTLFVMQCVQCFKYGLTQDEIKGDLTSGRSGHDTEWGASGDPVRSPAILGH